MAGGVAFVHVKAHEDSLRNEVVDLLGKAVSNDDNRASGSDAFM